MKTVAGKMSQEAKCFETHRAIIRNWKFRAQFDEFTAEEKGRQERLRFEGV